MTARFDPRANSLDLLRLSLAVFVALAHGTQIAYGHQPRFGHTDLGALAVDGFFVLSGFLVAGSFLRLGSPARYAWHRALRILPGFWLCLVSTALVVAPVLAVLEGGGPEEVFFGERSSFWYAADNAFLMIRDYAVAGLPTGTRTPGVINGSLWTLWFEAVCYVLVVVLGVVGALRPGRRRLLVVLACVGPGLFLVAQEIWGVELSGGRYMRFFFMFLLGTLALLYGRRLPMRGGYAWGALAVVVLSVFLLRDYRPLGGVAFAYLMLWAVVGTPWLRRPLPWDLSYGVYVYHWPIATILTTAGTGALPVPVHLLLLMVVTGAVAVMSWLLVERPALQHKDAVLPFVRVAKAAAD
ncbi:acyltransferase family protein [Austwickia chelonae]|uniref:acyltransferase family protein n=1 Tax=Austwickia chelonae TaxID=100225 RepID=UPI00138AE984|nr:acyltransferase [Austwickia chelonae]